ncbi:galactose-6-phosphate isomerase subunit LacA [Enterococcus columbae]|uniref:Galactose-6-phosphate isomerase, LacA subunit n=1 Tax=Enterococcus columbae DSM 7374 = ATCC 51263 TaxID=1121865 RepID=S0KMV1_9ENTE|nr:galactose-6-phosphate isomerase subunit LacA [Enterococcus columbae]EOT40526.1 galactose-6-phosphate isomerase, LacA subunit [Enterococcus columbae DSM 7374 = ATCC 51263]EOW80302.1 galactose-6-phosphate isomerase, LacA subunit [Enterococcus columbae DSM 7374 = ATCC 51263]OJG25540.1 galactose-6-phosphate isomerase, LacA subunit [Enterococcus columbae DSM 7374 = ATCC 51263]
MKVFIAADNDGFILKNRLVDFIHQSFAGDELIDLNPQPASDFVEGTLNLSKHLQTNPEALGIMVDGYGAGSFMVACKVKQMVVAEVSDERSAYMTREHNNARMITLGAQIVGNKLAENIVKEFLSAHYAAGRHQIRVDMLNKMA